MKKQTFFRNSGKSKITLNFRPFEGFNQFFWQKLNNLDILEGIYPKENRFLSCNVIISIFLSGLRSRSRSRPEPKLLAGAGIKFRLRLPAPAPGETKSKRLFRQYGTKLQTSHWLFGFFKLPTKNVKILIIIVQDYRWPFFPGCCGNLRSVYVSLHSVKQTPG